MAGEDRYGDFDLMPPPTRLLDPNDIERTWRTIDAKNEFLYAGAQASGKRLST